MNRAAGCRFYTLVPDDCTGYAAIGSRTPTAVKARKYLRRRGGATVPLNRLTAADWLP
jgi:hypothetical protein